mgnify:CR=1 FL=1
MKKYKAVRKEKVKTKSGKKEVVEIPYTGVFYRIGKRIGGNGDEKIYYITYKKNGKKIEERVGRQYADRMTPAQASNIRSAIIEGRRLPKKEIKKLEEEKKKAETDKYTIDKLWEEYKLNRTPNKGLDTDSGRYNNYLKKKFGGKEPKELVKKDVDQLRIDLLNDDKSPQTVKHILNLLTWIINYGFKNNLCEGISFHIQKPTVNNEKTEDLNQAETESLLSAIEADSNIAVGNMMKLSLYTGMRRGELFRLKWKDLNFETGFIWIRGEAGRGPKGGKDQKIPMNNMARKLLLSIRKTRSPYVFPGRDGGERTKLGDAGRRILDNAGLPKDFRPTHGLRHVYASNLASSGEVDMYVLQKLMTHKSPQMTQRYAHLRDDALKKAASQIDIIFGQIEDKDKKE